MLRICRRKTRHFIKTSGKGNENKWSAIRTQAIPLLNEEIKSDQPLQRFKNKIELTMCLPPPKLKITSSLIV